MKASTIYTIDVLNHTLSFTDRDRAEKFEKFFAQAVVHSKVLEHYFSNIFNDSYVEDKYRVKIELSENVDVIFEINDTQDDVNLVIIHQDFKEINHDFYLDGKKVVTAHNLGLSYELDVRFSRETYKPYLPIDVREIDKVLTSLNQIDNFAFPSFKDIM